MSAALGLFRLQQVDSRITQVEARLRRVRETLENDAELRAALDKLKAAEQEERRLELDRHMAEEGAREQQLKIKEAEASLYGGAVHNPKELQELQADIASLKKRLTGTEERELQAMVGLEAAESARQNAQAELAAVQSRLGEANRHLLDEQASLSRTLEDLRTEREAAVAPLEPGWLQSYEALRESHRGVAVAEVGDNSCGACGATLTAALQQSARHAVALVYCPSCGRILFAG